MRVRFLCVPDEEAEDVDERSTDELVRKGMQRRLRDHRRADEPAHRDPGEGRAGDAHRGARPLRARLDAVAGRQRRAEGVRRLPQDRGDGLRTRVLRAVRPPFDQPRADRGRRRLQQGARPLRDGRRHPLPARTGPRRDPRADPRAARRDGREHAHPRSRARLAHEPLRARAARRGRPHAGGRGAVRRPRRRVGRRSRSSKPAYRQSSSVPPAAAITDPTSGSRSARCRRYREALGDFVRTLPDWLARDRTSGSGGLQAIEGGLA